MGTQRQGIHKDIDMMRMDSEGKPIGPFKWEDATKIEYEEIREETVEEAPCQVRVLCPAQPPASSDRPSCAVSGCVEFQC
eukprot:SAG11_NODE_25917_length_352_cov_0.806324_1_plen_79_part_10